MQQSEHISVADIARRIGCSPVTIWRAIQLGELPAASLRNGRKLWVPRDAAEEFIAVVRARAEENALFRQRMNSNQLTFDDILGK